MPTLDERQATELFQAPPQAFLDVGRGPEIAYRRVGEGPDVLFVHGWPVSAATFRGLLPHLADHVTCHLVDLPGTGQSRLDADTPLSIDRHIQVVRQVVDVLDLDDVAVVGHDSGGMIARHALAGDRRLRAMGLIDTEQPQGLTLRFRLFLAPRALPGFGALFGWAVGQPGLRRHPLLLGDAFADPRHLDGAFSDFFLRPLHEDRDRRAAAIRLLRSFQTAHVQALHDLHRRIEVPVRLVWGDQDPFFPLALAREMVDTFPDASLHVVEGGSVFCHEESPEEVARALRPTLVGGSPDVPSPLR